MIVRRTQRFSWVTRRGSAAVGRGSEDRSLTAEEMLLWRGFLAWNQSVLSEVARELLSETGLTSAEFQILVRLSESPPRTLEQRELAADLEWSASRLSHQLSRMQKREQITRTTNGAGHVVQIALTPRGHDLVMSALHVHARAVRRTFLAALTADHRRALTDLAQVPTSSAGDRDPLSASW